MDLQAFRALTSPEGRELLAETCAAYDSNREITLSRRLRRNHPPELVIAALTQANLRQKARIKFDADADAMFFTPDGLEQTTAAPVAAHRAARIAAARPARAADLCCGIGADLIALARAGCEVVGFDHDPLAVQVARSNLAALDLTEHASVGMDDVLTHDYTRYDAVTLDPARRSARGRVGDPSGYSPPWPFAVELLGKVDACVKTAPAIAHEQIPYAVEAEWVSLRGEVKEAALWSGTFTTDVSRRASLLPGGYTLTDLDDPGPTAIPQRSPEAYLYEPDGAVIRASLVTAVAHQVNGAMLDPRIAYVTSDRLVPTPFATAYAVREVLPYDEKAIRGALATAKAGKVVVKKRGLDLDPEALRRRVRSDGPNSATVVIARIGRGAITMICDPVPVSTST